MAVVAGERRIVTVLFADIVGSTAIGEKLGPERTKLLLDEVMRLMSAEVERYEGTVAQYVGDELYAVFGAPVSHEDDSERAVRAALAIQHALDALRGRCRGGVCHRPRGPDRHQHGTRRHPARQRGSVQRARRHREHGVADPEARRGRADRGRPLHEAPDRGVLRPRAPGGERAARVPGARRDVPRARHAGAGRRADLLPPRGTGLRAEPARARDGRAGRGSRHDRVDRGRAGNREVEARRGGA